jgi:hypothetical protein
MANPNILDATSVKYFNLVRRVEYQEHTPSTSPTSDYQTKTLVLKNLFNSGKVIKINRIRLSLQRVYNRTTSDGGNFALDFITDYTASDIVDRTYSGASSPFFIPSNDGYSQSVIRTPGYSLGPVGGSTAAEFLTVFPPLDTTGDGFLDQFTTNEYLYLNEGQALAIWMGSYGSATDPTDKIRQTEYFRGRGRVHIQYEEYTE